MDSDDRLEKPEEVLPRFEPPDTVKRIRPVGVVLSLIVIVGVLCPGYAETISPRRLVEVTDLGNPVISPDGRKVAFRVEQASIERNTYDTVWYVQELEARSLPRRVADGGVPIRQYDTGVVTAAPAVWSPDSRRIYYRAMLDGQIAVWEAAADGSGAKLVTYDPADVREFELSTDGRILRYAVGATREEVLAAEQAEYDRGVHIDETVFIGAGLVRSSQLEGRLATQRFVGNWFEMGPLFAKVPARWKVVDLATQTTRDASKPEAPQRPAADASLYMQFPDLWTSAYHPADDRVAIVTRPGKDQGRLDAELAMLRSAGSSRPTRCEVELCVGKNIHYVQWRPDSDDLLFTVVDRREGRAQSVFRWDTATGKVHPVVRSGGLLRGSSQRHFDTPCGISFDTLVCVAAEADRPPRLEAIDIATGRRSVLFDPNLMLAMDIAATTPARSIHWRDERGAEFSGWLFEARRDSSAGAPPLFVTMYTCDGFLRGGLGDEWPLASLAGHGISSACINGNPGSFELDEYYGQAIHAVTSLLELLADQGKVDPFRVGMGGLSHGTELTMWVVTNSDLLSAASVASPSVSPNWYLFNSLRDVFRSTVASQWRLGEPREVSEQWRTASPAFKLDKVKAPVLFQMPEQEYLMALEYVLPLIRRHLGQLYVFPNEAHIKFQPRHKLAAYERNLDWFRFWLQDVEDDDPTKAEQYSRWRLMKERMAAGPAGADSHAGED